MAQMKKCIVILLGIAFAASLATACGKECTCKDSNGEAIGNINVKGTKSCEDACIEKFGVKE